ncbi:MAG: prolipoprotein diacylglyceryl transferase family protein, partial [Pseudomonadota bacterium]
SRPTYAASGVFSLGYGMLRFFVEFFREPDAHLGFQALGWVTRGQLLCIPMMLLGVYLLWLAYGTGGRKKEGRGSRKSKPASA